MKPNFAIEEKTMNGDKIKINEIVGKTIIVNDYKISNSKYEGKECLTLQFKLNNEDRIIFTGSTVLTKQCKKYKNMIPFETIIQKVNNKFYSFK